MSRYRGNWETGERRFFRRVLVVGAGRAGVAAAEELRRQGFGGEIVVMCDEPEAPYDRPSCSKGILNGTKRPKDARMPVRRTSPSSGRWGCAVPGPGRVVMTDTDESYRYDGLVIATGAPVVAQGLAHRRTASAGAASPMPAAAPGLHRPGGDVGGSLTAVRSCTVRSLAGSGPHRLKQQVMAGLGEIAGRYITEVARDEVELAWAAGSAGSTGAARAGC